MSIYRVEVIKFDGKKMFYFDGVKIFHNYWSFDLLGIMKAKLRIWRNEKLYDQAEWLCADESKYANQVFAYAFRKFSRRMFDRHNHGVSSLNLRSLKVGDVIEIEVDGNVDWMNKYYLYLMNGGAYGKLLQDLYPLMNLDHWEDNLERYKDQYSKRIDELKRMLKSGVIEYVNYFRYRRKKPSKGKKRVQVLTIVEYDGQKHFELNGYCFNKMDVFYGIRGNLQLEVVRDGKVIGIIYHYEVGTHAARLMYHLCKPIGSDDYLGNLVFDIWADKFEIGDVIHFVTEESFDLLETIILNFSHGENPIVTQMRNEYPTHKVMDEKLKEMSFDIRREIEQAVWTSRFKKLRAMVLTKKIPVMDFNKE